MRKTKMLILITLFALCLFGCQKNQKAEQSKDESTPTTSSTSAKTSTTSTSAKTSTTSKKTTCAAKKFANTYSYVFKTKDECQKNTDKAFMDIIDNKDSEIFADECIEIKDDCNDTYYGIVFYYYDHTINKEVKRYY